MRVYCKSSGGYLVTKMRLRKDRFILFCLKLSWFQTNPNYDRGVRLVRVEKIDGFHSDVIKLLSQNSEVLLVLVYTRLKTNKK